MMNQLRRINQVIILGAGASKSEGAPLQNELFEEFFSQSESPLEAINSRGKKLLFEYFKDFWGFDFNQNILNGRFPTFEECLGILDLSSLRNESIKGYPKNKINEVRNALIFLIAKVLDDNLRNKIIHHKSLINRLNDENKLKETVFISLNYDIIIDNVLTDLWPEFHLDYGIDFVNYNRVNDWERPNIEKSILLLKIHGSLNWLYCPTCNHMELSPQQKIAINAFYREEECNECKTPMQPVIIPPTFYKEMSNPFIQQIFLKSDLILRQINKLYICGYSFPDADIHVKYLIKRSEQFLGETPDIFVINNHLSKSYQKKEEEKYRYMRFVKNKKKVHYTDISFEQFSIQGLQL